jgi:hypothetical protein
MTRLEEFLRKEGLLTKFKRNLSTKKCCGSMHDEDNGVKIYKTIDEYFEREGNGIYAILSAFIFTDTPEGIDWYDIDDKYYAFHNKKDEQDG